MNNIEDNNIRINRVKKYIFAHLDQKLPLEELAAIASFSPFHFQRIFKSLVGETPKQYIKRLRLEGASHHIYLKPETAILEVALQYGFASLEAFSRAFKDYYGLSPTAFRQGSEEEKRAAIQAKTHSALRHVIDPSSFLPHTVPGDAVPPEVEVLRMPPQTLLYLPLTLREITTVVDAYKRIKQWASARELLPENPQFVGLLLDYPAFTALEKCRFYPSIVVESMPEVSGGIECMQLPARTYASFQSHGGINELVKTVTLWASQWLPQSGYEIQFVPAVLFPQGDPTWENLHDMTYRVYIGLQPR